MSDRTIRPGLMPRLRARLELRMLALAVVIFIALSLASPYFLRPGNLLNQLDQSVVTGIVAAGMTFVILIGGIDLSVGSVLGVTAVLMGLAMPHVGIAGGVAVAVIAGGAIGAFSGFLIARFGLAAFVVTLGVMAIGRSLAYIFSGATSLSNVPPAMNDLVYTPILGVPSNVATLIVIYVLGWLYLTYTKGGRVIYAVGSNHEAARTAGLNVLCYSILPYVISGALAAVAGVLLSGRCCASTRSPARRSSSMRSRRW